MNSAARRRPGGDEIVTRAFDVVERPLPRIGIDRAHERGVADDLGHGGAVAADDGSPGRHRLEERGAEALVLGREHERLGGGDQPVTVGRRHPARPDHARAEAEAVDRGDDLVLGESASAEQHERQLGIVPRSGEQFEQEAVVLVRMRDRRVHEVTAVDEAVALAHLAGVRRRSHPVDAVRHHDDVIRIASEAVDDGSPDVLAGDGDRRCPANGEWDGDLQVLALHRTEVLGERAVLHVVDGQQDRPRRSGRNRAAGVVDDVGAGHPPGQPGRLGEHAPAAPPRVQRGDDELVAGRDLAVRSGEPGQHEHGGVDVGRHVVQADELAGDVLLRAPDEARQAPQQVDGNVHAPSTSR